MNLINIDGVLAPAGLRCEYQQAPLGIDETKPRLSWRLESGDPAARGLRQTAYQLLVASSREALDNDQGDLWDSGKISWQANRCEYAGKSLTSRWACHWKVRAWDQDGKVSAWSAPALWTMGLLRPDDWSAKWILEDDAPPEQEPIAPLFRKTFALSAAPVRATVYVSSLGYHELYLNGQKVGRDVLAPQVTVMDLYVFYVTHDVSTLVNEGQNCLGLWLGDGFVGRFFPDSRPQGIVQLEIECRDGSRVTITSDETWKTRPSPIRRIGGFKFCDYGGERWDGSRELPDWCPAAEDDTGWKPVRVRTAGTPTRREALEADLPNRLKVYTPAGTPVLRAQMIPPNVVIREVQPKIVQAETNQTWLVDMGQMITGWFAFAGQGTPGQVITLDYMQAFAAYDAKPAGMVTVNFVDLVDPDASGRVRFCNKFNYHTFRYVRIKGLVQAPDAGQIKAMLLGTGLTPAFSFSCSNDLANRIHQASMNTFLANSIGGYISDCPDRERGAYVAYGLYYAPFLMQHFVEGVVFLEKMVRDGVDAQRQDGLSATCSPVGYGGGALWTFQNGGGYVFVQTPWQIYLYTGDKCALGMSLAASEKYLTRMEQYFDEKAGVPSHNDGPWCYLYLDFIADWLAEGVEGADRYGQSAEAKMIQTNCMYIVSLDRLSKRLEVLGDGESAARYRAKAEAHRRLFHANCYKQAAANYGIDHMTYLAEPLLAEVPPKDEEDAVFRSLENHIRVVANGHPQSGDGGLHNLLRYLLARNRPDLVYLMVNQTDRPSWGAMVKNGDAAIWEDWIMSPDEDPPHSRSHAGLGSIGEWFINGLAGIQYDPAQPGFQHAVLRPFIPPDMDQLAASSDSSHGTISIRWKKVGGAVSLEVVVPPNTTATLFLPMQKPDAVTEAGRPLAGARGVKLLGVGEVAVSVALDSGAYAFAW